MDINNDHLYTIKESSKITSIPERTLSRNALKEDARKIDGRYLFSGNQLKGLIERRAKAKEKKENLSPTPRHSPNISPLSSPKNADELEVLVKENESLKMEVKMLKEDLQQYDIADNERLEIFTEEMYLTFEQRLIEWREQNEKIKTQQELFNAKEKGLNDVVEIMTEQSEHYKNQFEYQKEQSTRILDMHEQLIKTIQQNNYIEAKSKGFDKK
tara:strand:+ start:3149 stop:3790 length:642 start_codon:yes stop_codon:yes gene_type:complete